MALLIIGIGIWMLSALARAGKEATSEREAERQRREQAARSAELARMTAEWKAQREADEAEAIRQAAILAEEKRQEQEEKLKRRISDADGEIEYQRQQIERLRQHMEHSEIERDACVYGSTRYFQWDKKCMTLEHQIHTAEARLSKAKDTKFFCEEKLAI